MLKKRGYMLHSIAIFLYRVLENIDGEHGKKWLCYRIAEKIKMYLLKNWIE